MHDSDDLNHESKSKRKRQMTALQDIGKTLVELSQTQLDTIPLESPLAEAITLARSIKDHEGKRRQLQYIGKLMRHIDTQPIQDALNKIQLKDKQGTIKFHQIELWRDRLIAEKDAILQEFVEKFPDADRQHIRQLVRNAQQDFDNNRNTGAKTALFRYLQTLIG